jgi:hypothetical protein
MLIGAAFAIFAYWLITVEHFNPLLIVPAIVATTLGATHLITRETPGS